MKPCTFGHLSIKRRFICPNWPHITRLCAHVLTSSLHCPIQASPLSPPLPPPPFLPLFPSPPAPIFEVIKSSYGEILVIQEDRVERSWRESVKWMKPND